MKSALKRDLSELEKIDSRQQIIRKFFPFNRLDQSWWARQIFSVEIKELSERLTGLNALDKQPDTSSSEPWTKAFRQACNNACAVS